MYLRELFVSRFVATLVLAAVVMALVPMTVVRAVEIDEPAEEPEVEIVCEVYTYSDEETEGGVELSDDNIHPNWLNESALEPAQWIWSDNPVQDATVDVDKTFSDTFEVGAGWTSATLEFAADNGYQFLLNETEVAEDLNSETNYGSVTEIDITDVVVEGENLLEVTVRNLGIPDSLPADNPAGVIYRVTICAPETISIGGWKWEDSDEDGYWDENDDDDSDWSESGMEGVTIQVYAGDELIDETETDEDGWYQFDGLTPGVTYTVCEIVPEDYYQTYPYQNDEDTSIVSCDEYSDGYEVTPKSGDEIFDLDFGNAYDEEEERDYFLVSGYKWNDVDGDGYWDEGEVGLPGWTITIDNGEASTSTVTNGDGYYEFWVETGVWEVSETQQNGWRQTNAVPYFSDAWLADSEEIVSATSSTCTFEVGYYKPSFVEALVLDEEYNDDDSDYVSDEYQPTYQCDFANQAIEVPPVVDEDDDNSSSGGTRVGARRNAPTGAVLGAATSTPACGMFLNSYLRMGQDNPVDQVYRLQVFLTVLKFTTPISGMFDAATDAAVRAFQAKYPGEVLAPWGISDPTGYVYKTTRHTINNMVCPGSEPMPVLEGR